MREERCERICGIEKSIRSRLDGSVFAYAYMIGGGAPKFDAAGYARTEADGGPALAGITQRTACCRDEKNNNSSIRMVYTCFQRMNASRCKRRGRL